MAALTRAVTDAAVASATQEAGGRIAAHGLRVTHVDGLTFDDIAVRFRDVIHEQTHCFNRVRWAPGQLRYMVFLDGEDVVGGVVARVVKAPLIKTEMAIVRWGPLWRIAERPDRPEVLRRIYAAMAEELALKAGRFLLVFPRSDAESCALETSVLSDTGFVPSRPEESPERYFVNVDTNLDALRSNLNQKWRYNLKKAEKNGLTASFVEGEQGLTQFLALYKAMIDRKQFLDMSPIDTLPDLVRAETPQLRPKILIVEKDGAAVAGAVVDCSGDRAVYLYGATDDRALPLKAGYVMHWEVARYLTEQPQIKWYDLGGGSSKTCSLHQFKRGFAGKTGVVADIPPVHFLSGSVMAGLVGRSVLTARSLKDGLSKWIHRTVKAWP